MTVFDNMKIQPGVTSQPATTATTAANNTDSIPVATQSVTTSNPATQSADTVEISTQTKEKKGPVKAVKGFIANVKKFFVTTGAYIGGTFKGITSGAVAGSVVFTGATITNALKQKKFNKLAEAAAAKSEQFTKKLHKLPAKSLAIVAGVLALGANLWTASLNATEKQSEIDHRWTGH